jgi:hypothetical protein
MRFDGFSVRKPQGKKPRDLFLEKEEGSPADQDGKSHYRVCGIRFH